MFFRIKYSCSNKFLVIYADCEEGVVKNLGEGFKSLSLTSEILNLRIPGFNYEIERFNDSSPWYYV